MRTTKRLATPLGSGTVMLGGFKLYYGFWADLLVAVGWMLLVGPALVWFAGELGIWRRARNIGATTPLLTAFIGGIILNRMQAWPF